MDTTVAPSTDWKEVVAPDEARRFAGYARQFAELQARKSHKYGNGRGLHRKQLTAARGQLQVLGDLPAFASHGLFAQPAQYDVRVRLSNGGMDKASDRKPDIRGFSFSVLGVKGDSALGNGPAKSQDFTLINQEKFAFPQSGEFVDFVVAASHGGGALIKFLVQRHGLLGAARQIAKTAKTFGRPFGGFAAHAVHSAAPIACGPYAVRVRLVPHVANGAPVTQVQDDWNAEFSTRLRQQDLVWDLQLQPFVDEATTPIEDASVDWPTPYTTVARLTLPRQDPAADPALAAEVEAAVFDPWQALAAHRPLGDVMRARKVVYFESQKGRGAV
ncbi:catalase [Acidovorax sp. sif1233]|uniref:catalase n=1 Tax=Acidovorax sp. sif1233 TaxID=2854792 RepID=UPI001C47D204|nr:catalase [Acidovorax sp. sif1233]MBV7455837.1 catalase [Acidovorax sp. sif1233]